MHSLLNLLLHSVFSSAVSDWIILAADLLSIATIPSVLTHRARRPMAALSWILALFAIPFGGVVIWWLLGRTHLRRPANRRSRSRRRMESARSSSPPHANGVPGVLREILPFALTGDRRFSEGVYHPADATAVEVLGSGAVAFKSMEQAIDEARTEIRALFYIWQADATGRRIAERLAARAREGVTVRVLVDEVGSRHFLRKVAPSLRKAGAQVWGFLPASFRPWAPTFNFRNHRKLLLVDGAAAFVGGMNIGAEYEHDWSDQAVKFEGPVVANFDEVFQEDWLFVTNRSIHDLPRAWRDGRGHGACCCVIASGPDREEQRVRDGYLLALGRARHRVWLTSPYFVPDPSLLDALRGAAIRGVDVRVLTPFLNDVGLAAYASRSCHGPLIRAGVKVYEFLPRVLHSKNLLVDDDLSVVGSANVDTRSFRLNFELVCFLVSREVNRRFSELFEADLARSDRITAADVARRGRMQRFLESGASLLGPLL